MSTDKRRVVANDSLCSHCSVHAKRLHHRDFPEIWSEAGSDHESARHLSHQLTRAREGARNDWHREAIDRAIADVDSFIDALRATERAREEHEKCRCGPRGATHVEKVNLAAAAR